MSDEYYEKFKFLQGTSSKQAEHKPLPKNVIIHNKIDTNYDINKSVKASLNETNVSGNRFTPKTAIQEIYENPETNKRLRNKIKTNEELNPQLNKLKKSGLDDIINDDNEFDLNKFKDIQNTSEIEKPFLFF